MKFDVKEQEGIIIITPLFKRLDVTTAEEFKSEVNASIEQGKKMIVLNLSEVNFIDSRGLGSLISIFKSLSEKGWLSLCAATSNVKELIKLTRIDLLFDIYQTEKEAIQCGIDKKKQFDK